VTQNARHHSSSGGRDIEFRLIYCASFIVFLIGTLVARLMPWHWLIIRSGSPRRGTIISEATAATNRFVPFAFMG